MNAIETPVRPIRQRDLAAAGYGFLAGGRYVNPATREDLTGRTYSGGVVSIVDGFKPRFVVTGEGSQESLLRQGALVRTNMIRQSAGWFWTEDSEDRTETILVSVEKGGKHYYALSVEFRGGVTLATYPNSRSEPRLRPQSYGELTFGAVIGHIFLRGRTHSVYDFIAVGGRAGELPA
jgi:hypothetical protein